MGRSVLKLSPAEYNLLTYFLQNPDRPLTHDMILNSVWGYESFPNTRTVDAHVVKLRQKLEPEPNVPRHFLTVHGVGYRFLLVGSREVPQQIRRRLNAGLTAVGSNRSKAHV